MTVGLDDAAYKFGRLAAEDYADRGMHLPPSLQTRPHSLTRVLKGDGTDGTPAELEMVERSWRRGVSDVWDDRYTDRRN